MLRTLVGLLLAATAMAPTVALADKGGKDKDGDKHAAKQFKKEFKHSRGNWHDDGERSSRFVRAGFDDDDDDHDDDDDDRRERKWERQESRRDWQAERRYEHAIARAERRRYARDTRYVPIDRYSDRLSYVPIRYVEQPVRYAPRVQYLQPATYSPITYGEPVESWNPAYTQNAHSGSGGFGQGLFGGGSGGLFGALLPIVLQSIGGELGGLSGLNGLGGLGGLSGLGGLGSQTAFPLGDAGYTGPLADGYVPSGGGLSSLF